MSATSHLTEKDLIIAAVDTADLDPRTREHLAGCPDCRHQLAELTGPLANLSRLAGEMAPASRTRFRMPEQKGLLSGWFQRPFTLAAGAVATAMVALVVWYADPLKTEKPTAPVAMKNAEVAAFKEAAPVALKKAGIKSLRETGPVVEDTASLIANAGYDKRTTLSDFHSFVAGDLPDLENDEDDEGFLDNLAPAVESI